MSSQAGMASGSDQASMRRIAVLQAVPEDILAGLLVRAHWRDAAPGELILDFGDLSDDVFFVLSGILQILYRTPGGREFLFGEVRQGECFGEMAPIEGRMRSANVTARTAARLCIVPGAAFLAALNACPVLCLAMLRLMSRRLRENSERLTEIATLPIRQRLALTLLRLARPREGQAGVLVLSPPPTHQTLATLIGSRREAVTREMASLADEGLVEATRRAIILRQPGLLDQRAHASATQQEG